MNIEQPSQQTSINTSRQLIAHAAGDGQVYGDGKLSRFRGKEVRLE